MKVLKQLIKLHKILFITALTVTFLSIAFHLCWNKWLSQILDTLEAGSRYPAEDGMHALIAALMTGAAVILLLTISDYLSSCLASYTCEMFAHEMRMGYVNYYLQSDIQTLSKLNVGEEQSAMQNELKAVSDYFNENLFALMKQFGAFAATVVFLLCQNLKLTLLSMLPVIPLIIYCSFSSKIIKNYTEQCQSSKKEINGLADMILELFPIIQVYSAYKMVKEASERKLLEWENATVRKEKVSARLMSLSGLLSVVPLLSVLGSGGCMAVYGEISMGTFYLFINLSGNVSGFLQNMPGTYAGFRRFGASVSRLEEKIVWK